ncbi:hypothetical protein N9L68_00010 [bacterium]|nr:hypothetical protein [bacterium]
MLSLGMKEELGREENRRGEKSNDKITTRDVIPASRRAWGRDRKIA